MNKIKFEDSLIYKESKEFHNYYITPWGDVYNKFGKKLVSFITSSGYYMLNLQINKKRSNHYIHRLVAQLFIENPQNKPCVNHIDEDKTNNNVWNLEWVTYKENRVKNPCVFDGKYFKSLSEFAFYVKKGINGSTNNKKYYLEKLGGEIITKEAYDIAMIVGLNYETSK